MEYDLGMKNLRLRLIISIITLISTFFILPCFAKNPEAFYAKKFCQRRAGALEYRLPNARRIDCLTPVYAIEVDFSNNYLEALGQALTYACFSSKKAGVALILRKNTDNRYLTELKKVIEYHKLNVKIWIIPSNYGNSWAISNRKLF